MTENRPERFQNAVGPHPEPLGEGFDDQDRQIDALLTDLLKDAPTPEGLSERLFEASVEELHRSHRMTFRRETGRSIVSQWVGLAACLALLLVGGWWIFLASSSPTPSTFESTEGLAHLDESSDFSVDLDVPVHQADIIEPPLISTHAELALLSSTSNLSSFGNLSPYIATRDLRFEEISGDLVAVLDAMQNPEMQAYDVEFRP